MTSKITTYKTLEIDSDECPEPVSVDIYYTRDKTAGSKIVDHMLLNGSRLSIDDWHTIVQWVERELQKSNDVLRLLEEFEPNSTEEENTTCHYPGCTRDVARISVLDGRSICEPHHQAECVAVPGVDPCSDIPSAFYQTKEEPKGEDE